MGTGQVVYIVSRLFFGAVAAFFAIVLWSKTRELCWMFMVAGIIAMYVETIYSIMGMFGLVQSMATSTGIFSVISIILINLPVMLFIAAFMIMVAKKTHIRIGKRN